MNETGKRLLLKRRPFCSIVRNADEDGYDCGDSHRDE